jgi:hypothetical protein
MTHQSTCGWRNHCTSAWRVLLIERTQKKDTPINLWLDESSIAWQTKFERLEFEWPEFDRPELERANGWISSGRSLTGCRTAERPNGWSSLTGGRTAERRTAERLEVERRNVE